MARANKCFAMHSRSDVPSQAMRTETHEASATIGTNKKKAGTKQDPLHG